MGGVLICLKTSPRDSTYGVYVYIYIHTDSHSHSLLINHSIPTALHTHPVHNGRINCWMEKHYHLPPPSPCRPVVHGVRLPSNHVRRWRHLHVRSILRRYQILPRIWPNYPQPPQLLQRPRGKYWHNLRPNQRSHPSVGGPHHRSHHQFRRILHDLACCHRPDQKAPGNLDDVNFVQQLYQCHCKLIKLNAVLSGFPLPWFWIFSRCSSNPYFKDTVHGIDIQYSRISNNTCFRCISLTRSNSIS